MATKPHERVVAATCKRCIRPFKYGRAVGGSGRPRLYCAVCREIERLEANDFRPRKTQQRRCTHWSREEAADAHPT